MKEEKEKGDWNKFVKHEQVKLDKELSKLEKFLWRNRKFKGIT